MENWTITDIGPRTKKATRIFGPYTVAVGHSAYGGSYRITSGATPLMQVDRLPVKSIDEAIGTATAQISALVDALAPFSALAAELADAEAVIASTRALLTEAEAALARQEARIAELEAKAEAKADAATIAHLEAHLSRADKRLARYVRAKEQSVMGAEDAGEEGGQ
jgi:septal ring factor EnvC (AmiA/AmiB activator)